MQTTSVETQGASQALTLDDLAMKPFEELEALYRDGKLPATLRALNGALRGRMLAVRGLGTRLPARWLRQLAASRAFVWGGKSFEAKSDRSGTGINRVRARGVLGNQKLFPFETRFGESALDQNATIVLDYDLGDNPPFIRKVHDEIREVAPGLYLGPAMWKTKNGPKTVLWFALDTAS